MLEKNCSSIIKKIADLPENIRGESCIKEIYTLHISRNTDNKKKTYRWEIILERYNTFKVIIISFYLSKFKNSKGIKQFKRNKKEEAIDPLITLRLLLECFRLCVNTKENEEYSFGFYALDDGLSGVKEDINKRMSVYYKFLQRDKISSQYNLKQIGSADKNFYIGYKEQYTTEEQINKFIGFYEPIILEQIRELYKDQDSQKL